MPIRSLQCSGFFNKSGLLHLVLTISCVVRLSDRSSDAASAAASIHAGPFLAHQCTTAYLTHKRAAPASVILYRSRGRYSGTRHYFVQVAVRETGHTIHRSCHCERIDAASCPTSTSILVGRLNHVKVLETSSKYHAQRDGAAKSLLTQCLEECSEAV